MRTRARRTSSAVMIWRLVTSHKTSGVLDRSRERPRSRRVAEGASRLRRRCPRSECAARRRGSLSVGATHATRSTPSVKPRWARVGSTTASVRRAAESVRSTALTISRPQVDPGTSAIQMPSTSPSDDHWACQSMTGSLRVSRSRSTATKPSGTTVGSNSTSGSCVASLDGGAVPAPSRPLFGLRCRRGRNSRRASGRRLRSRPLARLMAHSSVASTGRRSAVRSARRSARRRLVGWLGRRLVGWIGWLVCRLRRWLGGALGEWVGLGPVDHVQGARPGIRQAAGDSQVAIPDESVGAARIDRWQPDGADIGGALLERRRIDYHGLDVCRALARLDQAADDDASAGPGGEERRVVVGHGPCVRVTDVPHVHVGSVAAVGRHGAEGERLAAVGRPGRRRAGAVDVLEDRDDLRQRRPVRRRNRWPARIVARAGLGAARAVVARAARPIRRPIAVRRIGVSSVGSPPEPTTGWAA